MDGRKQCSTAGAGRQRAALGLVTARRPGVLQVNVNPAAQTATVVFYPAGTCLADLRRWVQECGYHRVG